MLQNEVRFAAEFDINAFVLAQLCKSLKTLADNENPFLYSVLLAQQFGQLFLSQFISLSVINRSNHDN